MGLILFLKHCFLQHHHQNQLRHVLTTPRTILRSRTMLCLELSQTQLVFCVTLSVRDPTDKPAAHSHPSHHVCILRSHAACRKPAQRHRLQLRTHKNQRHGETHMVERNKQLMLMQLITVNDPNGFVLLCVSSRLRLDSG